MPRTRDNTPKYRLHKPSGQAVTTLSGQDHYLGPHGTAASRSAYDRLLAEWLAGGRSLTHGHDLLVVELMNAYRKHAEAYYRKPDGSDSGELRPIKLALRPLRRLYGGTPAAAFGPLAMKAVRQAMVEQGWSRTYVNTQVGRVKRMFRWAVENEMVPSGVYHALQALTGLKSGRTTARECEPVRPVPQADVDAVLAKVSPHVGAMIRLQLLTGMRPGEVCFMRGCDLDTSGSLWTYRPPGHKTAHHGHKRVVYLGPQAQNVLRRFLKADPQAFLFSPTEAEELRRSAASASRRTPPSCGNAPGTNRKPRPVRRPGHGYDVAAYRRAIARACDRVFPPPAALTARLPEQGAEIKVKAWKSEHRWHPHQLRHNAATALRKDFGLEAAQVILGHRTLSVTEVYAEKNVAAARLIMEKVG